MTPEEAIREMAARLIHQPNSGYDEIRELERVALGAEALRVQAAAERDEYGRDQYQQGVEDTQGEVARLREALNDVSRLAETVRAGMMLVGSNSSVAPAISREEAMLAHAALDSLAALAGGDSEVSIIREARGPNGDYIDRTIETVRNHRDADNCWPQWANIFADEIERLRAALDALEAERDAARRERDCSYGNARAWITKVKANTLTPEQARRCIRWYGRDWTVEQEDDELADWLERIAGGSE